MALGSAIWAGRLLGVQIKQSEQFQKSELRRRHNAARVVLPLALSSINEMCSEMSEQIALEYESFGKGEFDRAFDSAISGQPLPSKFDRIIVSDDAVQAFQNFVESLDNSSDIRHIAELIASIQILISRFNSFDRQGVGPQTRLIDLLLYVSKVSLLNDAIFNYARFLENESFGLVGSVEMSEIWNNIEAKAHSLLFFRDSPDLFFRPIRQVIEGRIARNASPWHETFE